ncbi:NAD(P) transhydrogenase subunit alpha [Arthrobacter sp. M4]|uniref:NAD(P) transhydrogenase subunit alpha n=1 Tax=Arthrobacter sp. M4 TaxID=218160 RepID=UPI001CDBBA05|nr:NAD(P) transhydrogenase subunit alpha [Arthrobacter sp. M4]MCA4133420.1 NAD(P) transhydrogenase subunit alpha [Arthrobacter sp. M4]
MEGISLLTITVLAVFVGFEVVSKVSSTLHTPLMSGANAIHGIILVGSIIVAGQASEPLVLAVALLAVVLATANLVGGFVVTDRMLEMFHGRGPGRGTRAAGARAVDDAAVVPDPAESAVVEASNPAHESGAR